MSRGGRGGRGRGRGGGGLGNTPWGGDSEVAPDKQPSQLFPEYKVPTRKPLTDRQSRAVDYYLQVRELVHAGPLYTQSQTASGPSREYGQDQINQRYGVTDKASLDPFTAVPMYSYRFEKSARTLPDFSTFPFCKEFFPRELHATLDGAEGSQQLRGANGPLRKKRKVLELQETRQVIGPDEAGDSSNKEALKQLDRFENLPDNQENMELDLVEDEEDYDIEDEVYDDDEEGDYNAEGFFDGGDDDDDGDNGDDGGEDGIY